MRRTARRPTVARAQLGLEQHPVLRVGGPKLGHPLGRLPEPDPGIGQAPGGQDVRVPHRPPLLVHGPDVVVGRVGLHRRVDLGVLDRIAPLLPLEHGQRQRVVQDGGQAVDEGYLGHHGPEQPGGQVGPAPISSPPALPPRATSCSGVVHPWSIRAWAQATKSVKVVGLAKNLPCSYQDRPISPPPRTWAMAKTKPRSRRLRRSDEKVGSMDTS